MTARERIEALQVATPEARMRLMNPDVGFRHALLDYLEEQRLELEALKAKVAELEGR